MDILFTVLAFLFLLLGFIGCIVPVLPGPPLGYLALLFIHWTGYAQFSTNFLITWAVITVAVTVVDLYLPVWMTKRFGGSRSATIGATVGLILGLFIVPPFGIIFGPFLGALFGQLMYDSDDKARAMKIALASFAAFILGVGMKIVTLVVMAYYCIKALFSDQIIGHIF